MIAKLCPAAAALVLVGGCALDEVSTAPEELSPAIATLWRYHHAANGTHYHTTVRDDAGLAQAGFVLEATAGRVLTGPLGGALPIYTANPFNHGGKAEDPPEIAGYGLPAPATGTTPLRHYRRGDDHLYSLTPFEHGGLRPHEQGGFAPFEHGGVAPFEHGGAAPFEHGGFTYEGVAGYVYP